MSQSILLIFAGVMVAFLGFGLIVMVAVKVFHIEYSAWLLRAPWRHYPKPPAKTRIKEL